MTGLDRGGYGVAGTTLNQILHRLGIRGVLYPGVLNWDTYPQAAIPATVTSGAASSYGSDATLIAGSGITSDFIVSHIQTSAPEATTLRLITAKLKFDSSYILETPQMFSTGNGNCSVNTTDNVPASRAAANAAVALAIKGIVSGDSLGFKCYVTVLKVPPQPNYNHIDLDKFTTYDVSLVGTPTSGTSWAYGTYTQLSASLSTNVLLLGVSIYSPNANSEAYQVALATGAAASEVDFGVFGHGANAGTNGSIGSHYDLAPYPAYIAAGTRVAVRSRAVGASRTIIVRLKLVTL